MNKGYRIKTPKEYDMLYVLTQLFKLGFVFGSIERCRDLEVVLKTHKDLLDDKCKYIYIGLDAQCKMVLGWGRMEYISTFYDITTITLDKFLDIYHDGKY